MRPAVKPVGLVSCRVSSGFWKAKAELVATRSLPQQWAALNDEIEGAVPSHAIENFRIAAGEVEGDFKGTLYQDSEVGKWLEAASYAFSTGAGQGLKDQMDEAVRLIVKSQQPDGYLNTYFTIAAPESRWSDLAWGHELYCAGHLIEAAVAHREATGELSLLGAARRLADCVDRNFGPGEGKRNARCGHPEIELALFRLYHATGEARYRDLACWFLDSRGKDTGEFPNRKPLAFTIPETKWFGPDYFLGHAPLRSQTAAEGHSVRAMYLYSAMADEYLEKGDPALLEALRRFWSSAVSRRMYITGGLGSQAHGERFTIDWDLPSDTAYAETCASIGLAFWASRMSSIDPDSRYGDVVERALYNGILSGLSMDGTRYFYVNPLEVSPDVAAARQDHEHVLCERVEWFGCACCPPNIARIVSSLPAYLYGSDEDTIYVHHYAASELSLAFHGGRVKLSQRTDYPWAGKIGLWIDSVEGDALRPLSIAFRLPAWCEAWTLQVNGEGADAERSRGYLYLRRAWKGGDEISLDLDMPPRFMRADSRIRELAGKVAIQRGPLVYCFESADNGSLLQECLVDTSIEPSLTWDQDSLGGIVRIEARGYRVHAEAGPDSAAGGEGSPPYFAAGRGEALASPIGLRAVPYHLWGNRPAGGEMAVWMRECRGNMGAR